MTTDLLQDFMPYLMKCQKDYSGYRSRLFHNSSYHFFSNPPDPDMYPDLQYQVTINVSLVALAQSMVHDFGISGATSAMKVFLGYHTNCKPLIHGTPYCWDVRPVIVKKAIFSAWHKTTREQGYRLLTENAASELCETGTVVILRRFAPYKFDWNGVPALKGNRSVMLINPTLHAISNQCRTSYELLNAWTGAAYDFTILANYKHDQALTHMWYYKEPVRRIRT